MNISTQTLPGNYVQSIEINLKKNKRLTILLNISAIFAFILCYVLFSIFGRGVRLGTLSISGSFSLSVLLTLVGLTIIVLVVHELIHGLLFWVFTRSRPVFAVRLTYAYAGAPTWYIPSSQYVFIALGPLVIIGVLGLLLMLVVPVSWISIIAFLAALNTGGAMGDLYVFTCLLKGSPSSFVNDTGDVFTFYERPAKLSQGSPSGQ